uniref:Putative secreted metalloprotease n=1 Tax=Ixodes ricinus TaxID=34613 RepID=A0A6B0V9L8_IXORI
MFAFTVLLILSLTGVHMVTTKLDTLRGKEVKLGVTVIVDLHYMTLSRNSDHMTRYLKTFLNSVELRFSDMTDPKISLILTDVVLVDAAEQEQLYSNNYILRNTIHGSWTRHNSQYRFPRDSGIILIMTGFDIWSAHYLNGGPTNYAEVNGACTSNNKNVALSEDDGLTFSGVGSAAQAIAMLLGANLELDLKKTPKKCSRDEGYLLSSYYSGVSAHYNLSPCGKDQIKNAILKSEGKRRECLFKEPKIESSVWEVKESRELPIDFFKNSDPCNLRYGSPSCVNHWKKVDGCKLECCIKKGSNKTVNKHDGAPCKNGICSNGECIPYPRITKILKENEI